MMAAASRFAFRCGNLAVGSRFDPTKNWSSAVLHKLARLARTSCDDALVLPKPSTKTSHSSSAAARRLAREPVSVAHDPENPGDLATVAAIMDWVLYPHVAPDQRETLPAFPDCTNSTGPIPGLSASMTVGRYSALQDKLTKRHIPEWASLLALTEYSLRIGTATAWVEAGATPGELKHLGAWASTVGEEVYARLSAERQLALQQAATHSTGSSLDALLSSANNSTRDGTSVVLQGAARSARASQPKNLRAPAQSQPPLAKRVSRGPGQTQLPWASLPATHD
eukprot:SAG31_NODE_8313_length_1476_cov_1.571532_1_plen_282_part_00